MTEALQQFAMHSREMLPVQLQAHPVIVQGMQKGLRAENGDMIGEVWPEEAEEDNSYEEKQCRSKAEVFEAINVKNEKQHFDEAVKQVQSIMERDSQGELGTKATNLLMEMMPGTKAEIWDKVD